MPLSRKDIVSLSDTQTYRRGEAYFRNGHVRIVRLETHTVDAEVRGSNPFAPYRVKIRFSGDGSEVLECDCDCPAFAQYEGLCKHIVAVILKAQSRHPSAFGQPGVPRARPSDNGARRMLEAYVRGIAETAYDAREGSIRLETVLDWNDTQAQLTFRVGETRMYIVQDLELFRLRVQSHATASYGKLTFPHVLSSFTRESRPLLSFLLRRYHPDAIYHSLTASRSYLPAIARKRVMPLTPVMLDELMTLFEGQSLTLQTEARETETALVRREDFRPGLRLQKTGDGAILSAEAPFFLLRGDRSVYVYAGGTVYGCSEAFSAACGDLLEHINGLSRRLFFGEKDLNALLTAVIPKIEPYARLTMEGDFEAFRPMPLVTKIYLDSSGPDNVTARMTFSYGEKTIGAFGRKNLTLSQDIAGEIQAESLLAGYFSGQEGDTLRMDGDSGAVYRLVTEGLEELSRIAEVYATEAFSGIKVRPYAGASVGVRLEAGLLSLDFDLEGFDLSELPDILASYRQAKKYHRLRDGSFVTLQDTALSGLSELAEGLGLTAKQLASGHAELAPSRALYLDMVARQNETLRYDRDQGFKRMLRDMREVENADFPIPPGLDRALRNYQKTGYLWLKTVAAYGFGGILADDMGLGKTLQVLALVESCRQEPERLPSLVVCPASLALNWESEAQRFTPDLSVLVVSGTAAERRELIARAQERDLVVTSYDLLKRDIALYQPLSFRFVMIDEAQYIKNQTTQNARAVKALKAQARFALTGTPVENSLAELWSIFDFLMPGYLFPYSRFRKDYEEPIVRGGAPEAAERLRRLVRPFLLRRLKKDVLRELPPKTETVLRSVMTEEQRKVYLAYLAQAKTDIAMMAGLPAGQERMAILAVLTRMRQICCDPALLFENYEGGSAKLEACLELAESCAAAGRRMLLFSQFTSMLDILQTRLTSQGLACFRLDGSTPPSRRLELVNAFNAGDAPLFLISLKAGGTGLNLTGADVVIHYDPWWNLSVQSQATDRAHRIGQKNKVQVYKLIAKDTIEERILKMQEAKAGLADTVIEESHNPLERLTPKELLALLEE